MRIVNEAFSADPCFAESYAGQALNATHARSNLQYSIAAAVHPACPLSTTALDWFRAQRDLVQADKPKPRSPAETYDIRHLHE